MIDIEKERCKLCGNHLIVIAENLHDNRFGMQGKYTIGYCMSCELGETFPKSLFEDVPLLYKESIGDSPGNWIKIIYRRCKRSVIGTKLIFKIDRANAFLNLLSKSSRLPKLLDIGCGVGDWLILLREKGYDCKGIDLNHRVVEVAIARGLSVDCRRFEELVSNGKTFEVVVLSQVLEHMLEPKEVLNKIKKLLKPGGQLLISVPNFNSEWRKLFKKHWINWYMPFHIFHFSKKSIAKILWDSGFKVEKINCYTPATWLINSVMVRLFDRYRVPNKNVNKWWHFLLLPFVTIVLILFEKCKLSHEADCLCVIAKVEN